MLRKYVVNFAPEKLLGFVKNLWEELIDTGVLSKDYDFQVRKKLVPKQPGDVPVINASLILQKGIMVLTFYFAMHGFKKFSEWYNAFCINEEK